MKITLVALNATYNHTNPAIRYLRDALKYNSKVNSNADINIFEATINDLTVNIIDEILKQKSNVIGISCYIWNITKALEISQILKKIDPSKIIILGGPEVSYESEKLIKTNPYIDYVITGEGENALISLIEYLSVGDCENGYPVDFSIRKIINSNLFSKVNFNGLPFIYENETIIDRTKQYYYETSRGCPFNCSYCLSSATKGVSSIDVDDIKKHFKFFIDRNLKQIKLVDRTFNYIDKRAIEIWKYLIDEYNKSPYDTNFHFEISADLLSDEALDLLKKAPKGIFRFEIGIQSTNIEVLECIDRESNFEKLRNNLLILNKNKNIEIHLDLIAGLPKENLISFKKSFNDVYRLNPDMIQLGFLKMLKGSKIRDEYTKYGIEFTSFPPYEIIKSDCISYEELSFLKKIEYLTEKLYNSGQFKNSLKYLIDNYTDHPFYMFEEFADYFSINGKFKRKISRKEIIELFFDYGKKIILQNSKNINDSDFEIRIFSDLLKFDYYMFDKKGSIESINFNFSPNHPLLDEEKKKREWFDVNGKWILKKPRLEHYIFDAKQLNEKQLIVVKDSFVLYEMVHDKPIIIDYIL